MEIEPYHLYIPSISDLIYLRPPDPDWYLPDRDPICHERKLFMTRGIYLINEWWNEQHLTITYDISRHSSYKIIGSTDLNEAIYTLHKLMAPVQDIQDNFLVLGEGATQIVNAALYAISLINSIKHSHEKSSIIPITPLYVTQHPPGYFEIVSMIHLLHPNRIFSIDIEKSSSIDPEQLLEYVSTPNNPDGSIRAAETKAAFTLHDRVNHWSLFMNEDDSIISSETLAKDRVSIFSLSKLLSFSGSRVGYAFVKDEKLLHYMRHYIISVGHGLNADGQFHCFKALEFLLNGHLEDFMNTTRRRLQERWKRLREIIVKTPLKLLNRQGPAAWIETPAKAVTYLLRKYHLIGTYGPEYGATENHVRINMLASTPEFNEFIWRLSNIE